MAEEPFAVYVETGKRRAFAGAVAWPGWCRSGRDETAALQALVDYGPRYAQVLRATALDFQAPPGPEALTVVERLAGSATTDFGAPDAAPAADDRPVDNAELQRLQTVLTACWQAFDAALAAAAGKELRKGPRGGGRDQAQIVDHVVEADRAYLRRLGGKVKVDATADAAEKLRVVREAMLAGLAASARGELPPEGPRGGKRWGARYFVRRVAWHALDHAWEIEDRIL